MSLSKQRLPQLMEPGAGSAMLLRLPFDYGAGNKA
jgi:hypothetical protein